MNNIIFNYSNIIPISLANVTKIKHYNQKRNSNNLNKISSKTKHHLSYSSREFGKEIINPSNLTTFNNQVNINHNKNIVIPIDPKIKKENEFNQIKYYKQIDINKTQKHNSNSIYKKPNNSISKNTINKNSKEKIKKLNNKLTNKNKSLKSFLASNRTISIIDDINIKDENKNHNIIQKINSSNKNNKINIINRIKKLNTYINKNIEDVEIKIHNNINNNIIPQKSIKRINVQEVDEYFNDIISELFKKEENYLPDPNYMSKQSDINHKMRAILIDWLIDVHLKYKLVPQTLYIAVNLIDRYLSKNETDRTKLQLVGVTAMFIACKYEEIYPPELKDFVYITDDAYVKSDVLYMEYKILKTLNFDITFPTQWSFLDIYRKKLDLNEKAYKLAWFLMELCLIDYKCLKFKMSILAASSILIACKSLGIYRNNWFNKNIGIEEKYLEECCKEIYRFYIYNSSHNLQAVRKKFSSSKYDEVSKIKII